MTEIEKGSVWAVLMVRDEEDVIFHTLEHLKTEGVTGVALANNLSSDGTMDEVHRWRDQYIHGDPRDWPIRTALFDDEDPAYYQSRKMTNLANLVQGFYGAEWIVPVDADELWCGENMPLADHLRRMPAKVDCVQAALFNYYPTSQDNQDKANPFERIERRDPNAAPLPKVALRWRPGMVIHQGNHGADGWSHQGIGGASVRHFPWRSPEQFERKVRNGAAAYKATDLPEDMGAHWRQYGAILENGGPEALRRDVYEEWFLDPPLELLLDPAPYRRWAR